jgi:hypothetical protein
MKRPEWCIFLWRGGNKGKCGKLRGERKEKERAKREVIL